MLAIMLAIMWDLLAIMLAIGNYNNSAIMLAKGSLQVFDAPDRPEAASVV